jgi:hypothetical protein
MRNGDMEVGSEGHRGVSPAKFTPLLSQCFRRFSGQVRQAFNGNASVARHRGVGWIIQTRPLRAG